MPQLSEVATIGASIINPYAAAPDSIESRAWMLWRAAIGTIQRQQIITAYDSEKLTAPISLRGVAKDLFGGVPRDLAAVYAELKDRGNAKCVDRGGRDITPIWSFRYEYNTGDPVAEVTELPVEAPPVAKKSKPLPKKNRTGFSMTQADQNAAILKVLTTAAHPLYVEEIAATTKLHVTTVRSRLLELIEGERAFRRHETLDERNGTPGRRHHLYWASADIPLRPAELFVNSNRKSGRRPGYVPPAVKTVLRRVEELEAGDMVSLSNATKADLAGVQELLDCGVIEYVNADTKKEVRLNPAAPKPLDGNEYVERSWPEATKSYVDGIDGGAANLGSNLEVGLKSLIEAEVARRLETRVANEVAELERRLAQAEAMRVTAQTELSELKGRVQSLIG